MSEKKLLIDLSKITDGERVEMKKLGILNGDDKYNDFVYPSLHKERPPIMRSMLCMPPRYLRKPITIRSHLPSHGHFVLIWVGIRYCLFPVRQVSMKKERQNISGILKLSSGGHTGTLQPFLKLKECHGMMS